MKYIIFLTALCITPCITHTMNKPEYIIPQAMIVHAKPIQTISILAHCMLIHFNQNPKSTRKELIYIIDKMKSLRLAQPPIKEKEIGFYWYKQKKDDSLADSFINTLFSGVPTPHAKSIFFARLAQYNDDLEKKSLISPNKEHVKNHFKKLALEDLVSKNNQHNIFIPQETIDAVTLSIPTSVGIKEFATLLNDIKALLNDYSLEEIQQTAKLIYHDQLNGKPAQ